MGAGAYGRGPLAWLRSRCGICHAQQSARFERTGGGPEGSGGANGERTGGQGSRAARGEVVSSPLFDGRQGRSHVLHGGTVIGVRGQQHWGPHAPELTGIACHTAALARWVGRQPPVGPWVDGARALGWAACCLGTSVPPRKLELLGGFPLGRLLCRRAQLLLALGLQAGGGTRQQYRWARQQYRSQHSSYCF